MVYVHGSGSLEFTGGTIGGNSVRSGAAIMVDGGSLTVGSAACVTGGDRIVLKGTASITISDPLTAHTLSDPLPVTLASSWDPGRTVAIFKSAEDARGGLAYLDVRTGAQTPTRVSLSIDSADPTRLCVASGDIAELIALLENPFADDLGLTLKPELQGDGLADLRQSLTQAYDGIESPDRTERFDRLAWIERQAAYLQAHRDEVEASVRTLSELGDPSADRTRTQQNFMFDNLDVTGYYLKPGQVNDITLYLEAEDPSKVSLAWRQVGNTESSDYSSLNLQQRSQLKNGANRIVIDLTDNDYGYMLYLRNDSTDNSARARLEAVDANEPGATPVVGTQMGEHPFYLHGSDDPTAFWNFAEDLRDYARRVEAGQAEDMTLLQMGDQGRAQFAIRATALVSAYAGIGSEQDAIAYVTQSNDAIQERLEFFWDFDGYEESEGPSPNAISRMRVHTCFSRTVSYPSTMYATGRYFHMPESSAKAFLSGKSLYGWGMSHEYGHVLDNSVLVVNEETNNMYSIAGARNGELIDSLANGRAFDAKSAYHTNAIRAASLWDAELERMAADPSYTPDWNANGWGHYIWAHLSAWWNGTHFFDGWDYSEYDHESSPFTEQRAAEVERWGAFGATMRMLRSEPDVVKLIETTTASVKDGTSRKYNRIAMAYTMTIGYDFASYLRTMGQQDLSDEVVAFCARYPEMPRKVHYYSLLTDAAELNGATPYQGSVAPIVTVSVADGTAHVEAEMPSDELEASTTAYELYRDDELVGFSRDGSFQVPAEDDVDPASFSVVSYDVRLNPSKAATAVSAPFDLTMPELTIGDGPAAILIDGPAGSTYAYEVEGPSVATIAADGTVTAHAAGTTTVHVTITPAGRPQMGPYKFTLTVSPRHVTLDVADATMRTGEALPRAEVTVTSGELLEGDELGDVTLVACTEDGGAADLTRTGTYQLLAEASGLGDNYLVDVVSGTLTVTQDQADGSWVVAQDESGEEIEGDSWTSGSVTIAPSGSSSTNGYDEISFGAGAFVASHTVDEEGEVTHQVRLRTGKGASAGATSSEFELVTRIDRTAPTVSLESEGATGRSSDADTIVARATDEPATGANKSSEVASIRALVLDANGSEIADEEVGGSRIEMTVTDPRANRVIIWARDHAGNDSDRLELSLSTPGGSEGESGSQAPGDGDAQEPADGSSQASDESGATPEGDRPSGQDGSGELPGTGERLSPLGTLVTLGALSGLAGAALARLRRLRD